MIARLLSAGAIQKDNAQITSRKRGLLFGGAYSDKHFSPLSCSSVPSVVVGLILANSTFSVPRKKTFNQGQCLISRIGSD